MIARGGKRDLVCELIEAAPLGRMKAARQFRFLGSWAEGGQVAE
jgi:hypothetical protein